MEIYVEEWTEFDNEYWNYQMSERNWISYFNEVRFIVEEAQELVEQGELLEAHEVLERVRITMRELRKRNGFPKFTADLLTGFHTIMGQIITIVNSGIDEAAIDELYGLYEDASLA